MVNKREAKREALRLVAGAISGLRGSGWPHERVDGELVYDSADTERIDNALDEVVAELDRRRLQRDVPRAIQDKNASPQAKGEEPYEPEGGGFLGGQWRPATEEELARTRRVNK